MTTASLAACGPMDVVFIIDDTGSMGGALTNVKADVGDLIGQIDAASGNDFQLGLISFKDAVAVHQDLAEGNEAAVAADVLGLSASGGGGSAEASDEALNTAVNGLDEADRPPGRQDGDFDGTWRAGAVKIAILITDAPPGGFDDIYTVGVDDVNAHDRALEALAAGIQISAVFVPTGGDYSGQAAIMEDYATTTGGLFMTTAANGTGTADAIAAVIEDCGGSSVVTHIHDAAHDDITNQVVAPGTVVHDQVVIVGVPAATGTVDFHRYSTIDCTGAPATESDVPLTVAAAESSDYVTIPGFLSYRVHYDGDATYDPSDGLCEPLTVAAELSVLSEVHDPSHADITGTTVSPGTVVHDRAIVTGNGPTPAGTVDFHRYSTIDCTGTPTTESDVPLTAAEAESSAFVTTFGFLSYRVHYDGDATYDPADGLCESLSVTLERTVLSEVHDPSHADITGTTVPAGTVVHDYAVVTGSGPTPTGTVDFERYPTLDCTGIPVTEEDVALLSGSAESSEHTVSAPLSYRVHYSGDANYLEADGPCEPLNAMAVPVVSSEVHDDAHSDITGETVLGGSPVHDRAIVTGSGPIATGQVSFQRYSTIDCTGTASSESRVLSGGIAESSPWVPTADVSYRVHYFGNASYVPADGPCEPLSVRWFGVTSEIHDSGHADITHTGQSPSTTVHDKAIVTASGGTPPTGTVDFRRFDTHDCSGTSTDENDVPLVGGEAESGTVVMTGPMSYLVHYDGDANYPPVDGKCEPLRTNEAGPSENQMGISSPGPKVVGVPFDVTLSIDVANVDYVGYQWELAWLDSSFDVAGGSSDLQTGLFSLCAPPSGSTLGSLEIYGMGSGCLTFGPPTSFVGPVTSVNLECLAAGTWQIAMVDSGWDPTFGSMTIGPGGVIIPTVGEPLIANPAPPPAIVPGIEIDCVPGISLLPLGAINALNTQHSVTATVHPAASGVPVAFTVAGANTASGVVMTNGSGEATFEYTGTAPGYDVISASAVGYALAEPALKFWDAPSGPALSVNPPSATNPVGTQHSVTAILTDSGAPVVGANVMFSVSGANVAGGVRITNALGITDPPFTYTGTATEADIILASATVGGQPVSAAAMKTWNPVPHVGVVFPVAGAVGDGGAATTAVLSNHGIATAPDGAVFVTAGGQHRVRRIDPGADGVVDGDLDEIITTVAGTGVPAWQGDGGPATTASLSGPTDLAFDDDGNLYIADTGNHVIRKVAKSPGDGNIDGDADEIITTIAGNGTPGLCPDGPALAACFNAPESVDVDPAGNVFVGDVYNHRVARVTPSGQIATIAGVPPTPGFDGDGGPAASAHLNLPLAKVDDLGNVYIGDLDNHRIRKVSTDGTITTIAGSGTGGYCGEGNPATVCLDEPSLTFVTNTGDVWIADQQNGRVWLLSGGAIVTVAGTGTLGYNGDGIAASAADLYSPSGVTRGADGSLYISDRNNHRVRRVTPGADGEVNGVGVEIISTVGGNGTVQFCGDGLVAIAQSCLSSPGDVVADAAGNIYIADRDNHRVRKISPAGAISTLAGRDDPDACGPGMGDGPDAQASCLRAPEHLALVGTSLFVSDRDDHRVREISLFGFPNAIRTVAGSGSAGGPCPDDALATGACLDAPAGIAVQEVAGDRYVFVAQGGGFVSRIFVPAFGNITIRTVLNDGTPAADVSVSPIDQSLYVAQPSLGRVERRSAGSNALVDGPADGGESTATAASGLNLPSGVHADGHDHLLVAETGAHRLVAITPAFGGVVTVFGGGGSPSPGFCGDEGVSTLACMTAPSDLFYEPDTSSLYFADQGNHRVRKVPADSDGDGILDGVEDPDHDGYAGDELVETDLLATDTDGDGCSDSEELLANQTVGGDRNPKRDGDGEWDFFDVPVPALTATATSGARSKSVTLADVSAVLFYVGTVDGGGPNTKGVDYDTDRNGNGVEDGREYDRQASITPGKLWRSREPSGAVTLADVSVALVQVGHTCIAAP